MFRPILVGCLCLCAVIGTEHQFRSRNDAYREEGPDSFSEDSEDLLRQTSRILEYDQSEFNADNENRIGSSEEVFKGIDETPDASERILRGFDESLSDSESSIESHNAKVQRNPKIAEPDRLARDSVNRNDRRLSAPREWTGKKLHRERRNLDEGWGDSDDDDYDWSPRYSEAEPGETRENSVLAGMIAEMMADSQWQLVLDLDLFKTLFVDPGQTFESSVREGDESYVRQLMSLLEPLREYDVSAPCLADLSHFFLSSIEYARSVRESYCSNCSCDGRAHDTTKHQWIFNVVDALGKVPAGILGGNNLWIGSWSACRRISVVKNRQGQKWSGQYCMASFQPFNRDNPLKSMETSSQLDPAAHCRSSSNPQNGSTSGNEDDDKCFDLMPLVRYGICTPDTCTAYDTKKIVDFVYKSVESLMGRQVVCNVDIQCRNNLPESQMSHDTKSMTVLFFLIFIVILMALGTLYDYIVYQKELSAEVDEKKYYKQQSWFVKTLLAFSVFTNGSFILRTEKHDNQIGCLHGTRVLSMFWIILGHTYYYLVASLTIDNLLPTLISFPQKFLNSIIVQATLAVDSFFYLSGMLTCYLFMQKFKKEADKGTSIFSPGVWSVFIWRRFTRLTPIYVVIMVLDNTLFTYISDGPFWRPIEGNFCRKSWWTNLIYMNNFLLQDTETCMGWTWYLANDMQFHILAPIFLILLYKWSKIGIFACIGVIISSSLVHLGIVLAHDYPPAPLLTAELQIVKELETYWPDVYVKPYIRCPPYLVGLLVGFALHKYGLKPSFPKWQIVLGWLISITLGLGSVFGLYDYARTGHISEWMRVGYVLFGRTGYAVSIAWVTFACATGYGGPVDSLLSWRAWIPLSRITFCAYLIHPMLLQIYYLSRPHPFHFTTFYQMSYLFAVAVVISYFTGFFLNLAFEAPVAKLDALATNCLESKLSGRRRRPNKESLIESTANGNNRVEVKLLLSTPDEKTSQPSKSDEACIS